MSPSLRPLLPVGAVGALCTGRGIMIIWKAGHLRYTWISQDNTGYPMIVDKSGYLGISSWPKRHLEISKDIFFAKKISRDILRYPITCPYRYM
jgi:hypothetical protein